VLLIHNHYLHSGGEDQVFAAEARLLEGHGHGVGRFTVSNGPLLGERETDGHR